MTPSRTAEWAIRAPGDWSSLLRPAFGTGSPSSDLSGYHGGSAAVGTDDLQQRRRDAGHVRHSAGWFPIPPTGRFVPADFRSHDLLRYGYPERPCRRVHCARFNFMTEARILVFARLETDPPTGRLPDIIVSARSSTGRSPAIRFRRTWRPRRRSQRARPRSIFSLGSRIAASWLAVENGFRSSVNSAWSANSEAQTTHVLESSARSWKDGSNSSERCGPNVRPTSTRMESL